MSTEVPNEEEFTGLSKACWDGDLAQVQTMVTAGADVNSRTTPSLYTPLHASSWQGHLDIVEFLIDHGADLNASTSKRFTSLNMTIYSNKPKIALLLLKKGASVNIPSEQKLTCRSGRIIVLKFTPLMTAARLGETDLVKLLLENAKDIEINVCYTFGFNALNGAAKHGHLNIVKLLIEHGADWKLGKNSLQSAREGLREAEKRQRNRLEPIPFCNVSGLRQVIEYLSQIMRK